MLTDEQIEQIASGSLTLAQDEAAKDEETQDNEEAQDVEGTEEHEEDQDNDGDDTVDAAEEAQEVEETIKSKERAKYIPRKRFDELNERIARMEARDREREAELIAEKRRNKEYEEVMRRLATGEDEAGDDEPPIDEKHIIPLKKELEGLKGALKEREVIEAVRGAEAEISEAVPDYSAAKNFVVASLMQNILVDAIALGQISQDDVKNDAILAQAKKQALAGLKSAQMNLVAQGKDPALFVYQNAKMRGFAQTATTQVKKPSVDMKAVQKARDEAGAPSVKRSAVQPNRESISETLARLEREANA